jgi:hypothetical protein
MVGVVNDHRAPLFGQGAQEGVDCAGGICTGGYRGGGGVREARLQYSGPQPAHQEVGVGRGAVELDLNPDGAPVGDQFGA